MIRQASDISKGNTEAELTSFYEAGQMASIETLSTPSKTIKDFRAHHHWSKLLHDFITAMQLPGPELYDGGIPGLVVPETTIAQAQSSWVFEPADFKRLHPAGATGIFMPAPANIQGIITVNIFFSRSICGIHCTKQRTRSLAHISRFLPLTSV